MPGLAQEFHISITPLGVKDQYLVRLERVAPGVPLAEEQVTWPVDDWLEQSRQLMNDPLFELLQSQTYAGFKQDWRGNSSLNLVAFGHQLYNALFQGSLRDSWMMAQGIAQNQNSVLRLRLGLKGNRLPRLPWEVLHAGDRPLATGTDIIFSRYQLADSRNLASLSSYLGQNQTLRILMAIAGPTDRESLALQQEAKHLQAELRNRSVAGVPGIQLKILEQPGREELTQALEMGQYQVFHYAGHSDLGAAGGDLYLVSGKTGLTETLSGEDLAGLLANNGVQMAVLNSCRGAYMEATDSSAEQNLAQALIKRGIPSVLAMAERIPDEVALTLSRLFYRNLNQGYPIDLSLSRARQGLISAYGSDRLYWALPVLYLQSEFDGFLTKNRSATELAEILALPDPESDWLEEAPAEGSLHPALDISKFGIPPKDDLYSWREQEGLTGGTALWGSGSNDAEPDYEEDSAIVADLFRQVSSNGSAPPLTNGNKPAANQPPSNYAAPAAVNLPPVPASEAAKTAVEERPASSVAPPAEKKFQPQASLIRDWRRNSLGLPLGGIIVAAAGATAIALLAFWFWPNRQTPTVQVLPSPSLPAQPPAAKLDNLTKADTAAVTAAAVDRWSQGDVAGGQLAVAELLNRGALPQAKAALEAIPKQQIDRPEVSFLRGRLAWESVQRGTSDYSIDDARRYWEQAIKTAPNVVTYRNALGFAYYAEGKFDRAIQVWFDALAQSEQKQSPRPTTLANKEILTTYAGLSLGLQQLAQTQTVQKRESLLDESAKLRQKVMRESPVDFQPEALSNNWMWPEKAIKDWRSLLQAQSGK